MGLAVMFVVRLRDDVLLLFVRGLVRSYKATLYYRKCYSENNLIKPLIGSKCSAKICYVNILCKATFNLQFILKDALPIINRNYRNTKGGNHASELYLQISTGEIIYIIPIMLRAIVLEY